MEQFLSRTPAPGFATLDGFAMKDLMNMKAALVIAHPGHELCLHGWLTLAKPEVFVLTDGSGRSGAPRLCSTARNVSEAGARDGAWFGQHTDHVIYQALLDHDVNFFRDLTIQLADGLELADVDYVVGDALEGYNPTHDICRLLINAAVTLVNQRARGRQVQNFDFPIIGPSLRHGAVTLELDEAAFGRKIATMRSCPELADEVSVGLDGTLLKKLDGLGEFGKEIKQLIESRGGADSFRQESLRPIAHSAKSAVADCSDSIPMSFGQTSVKPFYERYAELLVSAGHYQQVIRYMDHVAPIASAISDITSVRAVWSGS